MNEKIYNLVPLLMSLLVAMVLHSCSRDEADGPTDGIGGEQTCRLVWDADITTFSDRGARAKVRTLQDGDCIYLRFNTDVGYVDGRAVYDEPADEWILNYNGDLPVGQSSTCSAFYFEGEAEGSTAKEKKLLPSSTVCADQAATYMRGSNYVRLTASLQPLTGRIRFKGTPGQQFFFSGVSWFSSFNVQTFELGSENAGHDLVIQEDGYSPYVCALPLSQRTLSVYYDYQTYQTNCDSPILDVGRSGYMLLPTETAHNGWTLVKVEEPTLAAVSMGVISDTQAEISAHVDNDGIGTLLDAGFVFSTTPGTTLETGAKLSCGTVTTLNAILRNLAPVSTYYVRAYATNERGTSYGAELTFTTTATPTVPDVSTGTITDIQSNRATAGGVLVALGEVSQVTQYGHVWNTTGMPVISDSKTQLGATAATGSFTSTLTGLLPNTKYYVRAYAVNSVGTSYGEQQTFTTPFGSVQLTTATVSVKFNEAAIKGTLADAGGYELTERGVCWSVSGAPTVGDNVVVVPSVAATFTAYITGLTEKTTYQACAYVKTTSGKTFYGNVLSFTTPAKDEQFNKEGFGDDEDWTGNSTGGAEIGKEGFEEDEDWTR